MRGRPLAALAAIFVTLLWSSSYVLNQYAFAEGIGPFTLAGLRYALAAAAMITGWQVTRLRKRRESEASAGSEKPAAARNKKAITWKQYALLGLTGFMMAQGLQYAGQTMITPTQTSMILSIGNTLFLIVLDALWLRELRSRWALAAIFIAMTGVVFYHYPWNAEQGSPLGVSLVLLSCLGYAVHTLLCRFLLTRTDASPSELVRKPMLIGAIGMLLTGLWLEGMPELSGKLLLLLLWLGPVNGALASLLWAWSQRQLRAYESSLINNLMLLEVAALDIWMLGRSITPLQAAALGVVGIAILATQAAPLWNRRRRQESA
ncbi:DMT family transporter [Paenibacillus puerhi]|uniref:DMT family transporter n=1 Tax=Paenibacillus puerhi TaxID=2692622 RepID=UPI00135A5704|nr:DMT family transporter [Paenibacillus puerhi]